MILILDGLMKNIEKVEYLLKEWKAAFDEHDHEKYPEGGARIEGVVFGLDAAIRKLKEPPNTAMQIDTTPCIAQVHSVYRINGAKYCKDCGQDLRLIPVINS